MWIPEWIFAAGVKGFTSENLERLFNSYEPDLRKFIHQAHMIFIFS